jgi:hypothetical protein
MKKSNSNNKKLKESRKTNGKKEIFWHECKHTFAFFFQATLKRNL